MAYRENGASPTMEARTKNITLWVIQTLVAMFYAMQGVKLTGGAEVVANFRRWGFPDKFYLLIGALELLGAIGLLIPRAAAYSASGLIVLMLGAAVTHITHGEVMMLPMPIVPMLVLAAIVYTRGPWRAKQSNQTEARR